jgi:hypothetical protein
MKTPQLSVAEALAIANAPDPQAVIQSLMASGRFGPLYDEATMQAAREKREAAEAAFEAAGKLHPLQSSVH